MAYSPTHDLIITFTDNGKEHFIRTRANLPAGAPLRDAGYWHVTNFEAHHLTDAGLVRLDVKTEDGGRIRMDEGYREAVRLAGGEWFPPCERAND